MSKKKHKSKKGLSRKQRKLMKLGLLKPKKVTPPIEEAPKEEMLELEEFEKEMEEEKPVERIEKPIIKEKNNYKDLFNQFKMILIAVSICILIVLILFILDLSTHWSDNIHQIVGKVAPPWDWNNLF